MTAAEMLGVLEDVKSANGLQGPVWLGRSSVICLMPYPAHWGEDYRRQREVEAAWRQTRMPVWAEWAAWRWSGGVSQKAIGAELGGVQATTVSGAIQDYLFIETDVSFWVIGYWHGNEYWRPAVHGKERQQSLRRHFGERVPPFPGLVPARKRPDTAGRNLWIYRQRQAGRTLASIGAEVGLCGQRIRQICCKIARLNGNADQDQADAS